MAVTSSSQRVKGILSVAVLEVKNLKKTDWFGGNDCYAVISTEPLSMQSKMKATDKKQQTETYQITQIHNVSSPIFNEKFVFLVPEKLDALYAHLWGCGL